MFLDLFSKFKQEFCLRFFKLFCNASTCLVKHGPHTKLWEEIVSPDFWIVPAQCWWNQVLQVSHSIQSSIEGLGLFLMKMGGYLLPHGHTLSSSGFCSGWGLSSVLFRFSRLLIWQLFSISFDWSLVGSMLSKVTHVFVSSSSLP